MRGGSVTERPDSPNADDRLKVARLTLHPEMLIKDGKKQFAVLPYEEFVSLKERLEDMEDLLQLSKAKKTEGRNRSVPLTRVRRELELK